MSEKKYDQGRHHYHGPLPVIMYFVGVVLFIIGLFIYDNVLWRNILMGLTMVVAGYDVMAEGFIETITESRRCNKFYPNIHILMALAAIASAAIGEFMEGALLILIFAGAHFLEEYAEEKSRREITSLLELNPTEARRINEDGSVEVVSVDELNIGDHLQVLNGDSVPTDGVILEGSTTIDQSSINGESIPAEKTVGDDVFASTINETGTFTMEVTKDSSDTVIAKIIQMVEQSQGDLTPTASKIKRFEPKYVMTVLIAVPLLILIGPFLFGWDWSTSIYRGVVFLVGASPCALAASAVPATLSAMSNLARHGLLFKGGSYVSALSEIKAIAFDKTGTLTQGKPQVTHYEWVEDLTQEEQDLALQIVVTMERHSNHPLAEAISEKFAKIPSLEGIEVENLIGEGLVGDYQGDTYHIGKPSIFENVPKYIVEYKDTYSYEGNTVVYVSKNDQVIGLFALMDVPKEDSKETIRYFQDQGIHTIMITGDGKATGEAIGRQLGLEQVRSNVMPEEKAAIIKDIQQEFGKTVMVGDGVNDAPALVSAEIGVAMGGGTDIAIDAADAVLMQDSLSRLSYAHRQSKRLDRIVTQNIVFALSVVVILLILNVMGKLTIATGVIGHEGSTILVILNGLRLLTNPKGKDS